MSIFNHNYNNFNIPSEEPSAEDSINERIDSLNNTMMNQQVQLTTITERATNRIEVDPFRAVVARGRELKTQAGFTGQLGLDTYRNLIDQSQYGRKFVAAADTKSRLWEQRVGSITPSTYTNPAVVQQIRQSIEEGEPVSEFLPGGQLARQVREDQQVVTPETADALNLISQQRGAYDAKEKYSRYYSRPGVKEYNDLFQSGETLKGVFFQFSNSQLISNLVSRRESGFDLLIQELDDKAFDAADNTRLNILAGNELMLGIARAGELSDNQNVYGIKSESSFHPKIGYTTKREQDGTLSYNLSFISTQNVTPAMSQNKTIESMLVFDSNSALLTERTAGKEVATYTDYLMDRAKTAREKGESFTSSTLDFSGSLFKDRQYLYTSQKLGEGSGLTEISRRYYGLIDTVAKSSSDKLIISMSELTESGLDKTSRDNLIQLAKEGRAVVAIDSGSVDKAYKGERNAMQLYEDLAQYGALKIVPTQYLHEKTLTVLDASNRVLAKALGSANLTDTAMSGRNTEVSVVFGTGQYADRERRAALDPQEAIEQDRQDTAYLRSLQGFNEDTGQANTEYIKHMQFITGGAFNLGREDKTMLRADSLYTRGYAAEMPSTYIEEEKTRVKRIEQLASDIMKNNVSATTGMGSVTVDYRFSPESRTKALAGAGDTPMAMSPVGLRVNITSPEGSHRLAIDLTVNGEGSVVVSDLNKTLNQALQVNMTNQTQVLFEQGATQLDDKVGVRRLELAPGQSAKLNSFEIATALINTVQRQFAYQSEFELNDLHFRDLTMARRREGVAIAKDFLTQQFTSLIPEANVIKAEGGADFTPNLATLLYQIGNIDDLEAKQRLVANYTDRLANTKFGSDSTLFRVHETNRLEALDAFNYALESALSKDTISKQEAVLLANSLGSEFIDALTLDAQEKYGRKSLSDIRKLFIQRSDTVRSAYVAAAKTQSRSIFSDILAPFISAHESTYGSFQGKSRMPVFGDETNFELQYGESAKEIGKFLQQGYLNPLQYGHTSRISEAGMLWRALGSSSYGKKLELPGLGGLRQLNVVDTDLAAGAGVVHDYDALAGSVSNLRKVYLDDVRTEVQRLLDAELITKQQADILLSTKKIDAMFRSEESDRDDQEIALMYSSFAKAERLTQRIKNVVGSRPTVDLSRDFLRQAIGNITNDESIYKFYGLGKAPEEVRLPEKLDTSADNIISGRLRIAMSTNQLQRVKEVKRMLAREKMNMIPGLSMSQAMAQVSFEEVQTYFRKNLINLDNVEHGFIGPEELKRVGLVTGPNILSDPNYMNAGYDQLAGSVQRTRAKVNLNNLDSALGGQVEMARILGRDGIVMTKHFEQDGKMYDPGYYIRNELGEIEQVGRFGSDGFIELNNVYEIYKSPFGQRRESKKIKLKAFGQRAEGGTTVVPGIPNLAETSRGMNILEFSTYTYKRPDSGNRPAAEDGLPKGPFDVIKEKFFNLADSVFLEQAYQGQEAERLMQLMQIRSNAPASKQKTYAMMSPNNFKGFAIRGGVSMVGSEVEIGKPSAFSALMEQSGKDVAKSLALMFLGDRQVAEALASTVNDPIRRAAILNPHGKVDISKISYNQGGQEVSSMLLSATGFLGLSSDPTSMQLQTLKRDVIDALYNDELGNIKANQLGDRAKKLLMSARQSGVEYGQDIEYSLSNNKVIKIKQQVQLDDSDGIVKAAGVYASMTLFKTQLLGEKHVAQRLAEGSRFTLNELPLDFVDVYHGKVLKRDKDTGKVLVEGYDPSGLEGFTEESYKNTLDMIQGHLGRKLRNVDKYFDETGNLKQEFAEDAFADYQYNEMLLKGLEATVGKGPILYTQVDMTLSQSLVPAGMKDTVKAEYASYIGMTSDRLEQFREPMGLSDNELAKNVQHSYFMLLSLMDVNLFGIAQSEADARATFKLPFVAKDQEVQQAQRLRGFDTFMSQEELDLLSVASLYTEGMPGINRYSREAVQEVFKLADLRKEGKLFGQDIQTLTQYATQAYNLYETTGAGVKDKLVLDDGTEIDVRGLNRMLGVRANPAQYTGSSSDYLSGLLGVESMLTQEMARFDSKSAEFERLNRARQSIYTSKNIVLPSLIEQDYDPNTGKFLTRVDALVGGSTPASIAPLLGTDILTKISTVFGDHESEIIKTQTAFLAKLIEAQPTLTKLQSRDSVLLDTEEIQLYRDLIESSRSAFAAISTTIESDITRQAFGDHESFKGAVATPVNSNLLNPWEMVVGDRLLRLAGDSGKPELGKLVDQLTFDANKSRTIDKRTLQEVQALVQTYTARLNDEGTGVLRLTQQEAKRLLTVDPTDVDEQTRLERVYQEVLVRKGIMKEADMSPLVVLEQSAAERRLGMNERKMISTARIYSQILDFGFDNQDDAESYILGKLLEDTIDFDRHGKKLPTSLYELMGRDPSTFKNKKMRFAMDRLAQLSMGATGGRTGHPGGSAAATVGNDNSQLMTASEANRRAEEMYKRRYGETAEGLLLSDEDRASTIMKVPTISRYLSMLGDYDGDTHRIIVNKSEQVLSRINKLKSQSDSTRRQQQALETVNEISLADIKFGEGTLDSLRPTEFIERLSSLQDQIKPSLGVFNRTVLKNLDFRDMNTVDIAEGRSLDLYSLRKDINMLNNLSNLSKTAVSTQMDSDFENVAGLMSQYMGDDYDKKLTVDDNLDNLVSRLQQAAPDLQELLAQRQRSIQTELYGDDDEELEGLYGRVTQYEDTKRIIEARGLQDIRQFVSMYTSLPEFVTGRVGSQEELSIGSLSSLLSQKASLDGIKDHAGEDSESRVGRSSIMAYLLDLHRLDNPQSDKGYNPFQDMLDNHNKFNKAIKDIQRFQNNENAKKRFGLDMDLMSQVGYLRVGKKGNLLLDREMFREELEMISKSVNALGYEDSQQAIFDAYGQVYGYSSAMDLVGSMGKKASGEFLSPVQFDAAIQAIGEGGSKLIGDAYNTLMPMLNQTMIEAPFMYDTTTKSDIFMEYAQQLEGDELTEYREMASQLGVDIGQGGDFAAARDRMRQKFYSSVGVVSSFQQIVRDALKPPGGGNSADLFMKEVFSKMKIDDMGNRVNEMTSLADILKWNDQRFSTEEMQATRNKAMRQFLGLVLGTNLERTEDGEVRFTDINDQIIDRVIDDGDPAKAYLRSVQGTDWVKNMTGFGALMMLSDYTKTEEGNFYDKFIKNEEQLYGYSAEDYEEWAKRMGQSPDYKKGLDNETLTREFIKTRIVNMMQRTQAGFAAESIRSSGASNPGLLMQRALRAYQETIGIGQEREDIKGFEDVLTRYETFKEQEYDRLSTKQQQNADYRFLNQLLYTQLQQSQARTGAFTIETIDYLRTVQQDYKVIDREGGIGPTQIQQMSTAAINNAIVRLYRGKLGNKKEALDMARFQMDTLTNVLQKGGFDEQDLSGFISGEKDSSIFSDKEQATAAAMIQGLVEQMPLSDKQRRLFIKTLVHRDQSGEMGLGRLAGEAAGIGQIVGLLNEVGTTDRNKEDSWSVLQHELQQHNMDAIFGQNFGLGDMTVLPTDRMQDFMDREDQVRAIEQYQQELIEASVKEGAEIKHKRNKAKLEAAYSAEAIGILGSPLLFAMAGEGMNLDERALGFGVDVLQGLAEVGARKNTAVQAFLGDDMGESASAFSRARMRMAIDTEGLMAGSMQAIGQEMMYKSISGVSSAIAAGTVGRMTKSPNIVNVGTTIATEVVGSVLAQGVSRALYKAKGSRTSKPASSAITRMLAGFIEQVWKAAEDAQLQLIEEEYIVLDTDANMQMDFELDANPGDTWFDMESGLLIVDESGSALESNFDENDTGYLQTAGGSRFAT